MPTSYPVAADVTARLATDDGIALPASLDLSAEVAAAVSEWERLTGFRPFLVEGGADPEVRRYDPPGPRTQRLVRGGGTLLMLAGGIVSLESVRVGVTPTSAGSELEEGSDFFLGPERADAYGRPWTMIEFAYPQRGVPRSIAVEAVWGYAADIPAEAWSAVLDLACANALRTVRERAGQGVVEWRDGDEGERYSIELLGRMGDAFASRATRVAAGYMVMS